MSEWQPIETFEGEGYFDKADLWLHIWASPRSMGFSDSFRVVECWREDGRWFHHHEGKQAELFGDYITHWMPVPEAPAVLENAA